MDKGARGRRSPARPSPFLVKVKSLNRVRLFETPWTVTRLLRPRDSPGKNTGVGCQFLLQGSPFLPVLKRPSELHAHGHLPASVCSHNSRTRRASDTKPRATCNYRGSLCCTLSRGKTAGRSLRPCKPRFCYRVIPRTVPEPVLAGFSELGVEATLGCRGRPLSEREGQGSSSQPVVFPRRRSSRLVGERCLAGFHSALRLCRCRRGLSPFSLGPIRLHLCPLRAVTSSSRGGRCTEGGGRWSLPPSACPPPPGGPLPPVGC